MRFRAPTLTILLPIATALLLWTVLVAAPPAHAGAATPNAPPSICSWNATADFRLSPDNANPNPDACGHANVWSYLFGATAHSPSTYRTMAGYQANWEGHAKSGVWCQIGTGPTCDVAAMGVNHDNYTWVKGTITVPAGSMWTHPSPSTHPILAWTSPVSGVVALGGGVRSDDPTCGDGIAWALDAGASTLASGAYWRGGMQAFVDGTVRSSLSAVAVNVGDTIYLIIDKKGDYTCDSTAIDLTIVQIDVTAPTIDPVADITAEATSAAGAAVTYASPATHDAFDGDGVATCIPASGSTFALGATTVTCSATDRAGNTATSSFRVMVVDTTPPALALPSDIMVAATSPSGAVVNYATSARDIVDGPTSVSCAPASGSTFARGNTTVTCSSTDARGNTATGAFLVRVITQVSATASMTSASYTQADAALGGVSGTVHVSFPGGAPASGASVTVILTRDAALPGDVFASQSFSGTTDASGDFRFTVDLPYALLGSYTLNANVDWHGATASATGSYAVGLPSPAQVALAWPRAHSGPRSLHQPFA